MYRTYRTVLAAALSLMFVAVAVPAAYAQTCPDPKNPKCPPPPPTKATADCSPGFYKNHPETWCDVTCPTTGTVVFTDGTCDLLVTLLSAKGSGSSTLREFAKDGIDACFGTAALSPCEDD